MSQKMPKLLKKEVALKKKWIIGLSITGAIIGLLVLLSFTLFGLRTIEVDFRTSTQNISEQQILENVSFKKNMPVFFLGKKKNIKKIEQAIPYADVINIETVFPSKIIIHVAERVEVYAIKGEEETYICDENLKVLRCVQTFESTQDNAMLLSPMEPITQKYQVGDYISLDNVPTLYQNMYANNRGIGEQEALIESISQGEEYDEGYHKNISVLTLKLFSGQHVKIYNDDFQMKAKVKMFIDVYSQLFDYIGQNLKVGTDEYVLLTEENLKNCTIIINHFYDNSRFDGQICYFNIYLND